MAKSAQGKVKRVVLAYSGGLDTSIILKWLQETYQCEVVTFTADLGQGEELEPARAKALMLGIKKDHIFIEDLREEFLCDYVFPMFRANALYEGVCWGLPSPGRSSPRSRLRSRTRLVLTRSATVQPARATIRSASS
jgi:argininosuccinate synthase